MAGVSAEITELVGKARRGESDATARLIPLLYEELRRMAARMMARERNAGTLQPTALVHEAYLRLLGDGTAEWQNRAHFMGAAALAMRRILVDHARKRSRMKRGAGRERITLADDHAQYETSPEDLLALDQALAGLEARDAEMARVVELRYFGGLTIDETAEAMAISERTVRRHWSAARAWLHRALSAGETP